MKSDYLFRRVEHIVELQKQGKFVLDKMNKLPLWPATDSLKWGRDSNWRTVFTASWGTFEEDYRDGSILVLTTGTPPEEYLPQQELQAVTATIHDGYVSIGDLDVDFNTTGSEYTMMSEINAVLKGEMLPFVVCETEDKRSGNDVVRVYNDSAMLFGSSVIWDAGNQQLVAALVTTTQQELLKAIKATLANNSNKGFLTVKTPKDNAFLKSAKRGFIGVNNNLIAANANGTVTALLHPLSGDPQASAAEYFYVVIAPGEKLSQKFVERLDLAIPWPIRPEWADYLYEAGGVRGLVTALPKYGKDFEAGLRVKKDPVEWSDVIAKGLESGRITVED